MTMTHPRRERPTKRGGSRPYLPSPGRPTSPETKARGGRLGPTQSSTLVKSPDVGHSSGRAGEAGAGREETWPRAWRSLTSPGCRTGHADRLGRAGTGP